MAGKQGASGGRRKGAGRPKGTPNKRSQEVAEKIKAMGCDPIEGMARIAMQAEDEAAIQERFQDKKDALTLAGNMYKELAQYVAPKRRAVEVSSDPDQPLATTIQILPVASSN
ncbi:MAG: hypothetical protein R3183_13085 [Oleiphilaceae bacterium]|nr:hypothetical protein [Oleiphilaceae bacterium]